MNKELVPFSFFNREQKTGSSITKTHENLLEFNIINIEPTYTMNIHLILVLIISIYF